MVRMAICFCFESLYQIRIVCISGESRDAYFYAGTIKHSLMPNGNDGVQLQFPEGSNDALKRYTNENITIKVPKDLDTSDIRWLTVW